jgi:hypothetical protein
MGVEAGIPLTHLLMDLLCKELLQLLLEPLRHQLHRGGPELMEVT